MMLFSRSTRFKSSRCELWQSFCVFNMLVLGLSWSYIRMVVHLWDQLSDQATGCSLGGLPNHSTTPHDHTGRSLPCTRHKLRTKLKTSTSQSLPTHSTTPHDHTGRSLPCTRHKLRTKLKTGTSQSPSLLTTPKRFPNLNRLLNSN